MNETTYTAWLDHADDREAGCGCTDLPSEKAAYEWADAHLQKLDGSRDLDYGMFEITSDTGFSCLEVPIVDGYIQLPEGHVWEDES